MVSLTKQFTLGQGWTFRPYLMQWAIWGQVLIEHRPCLRKLLALIILPCAQQLEFSFSVLSQVGALESTNLNSNSPSSHNCCDKFILEAFCKHVTACLPQAPRPLPTHLGTDYVQPQGKQCRKSVNASRDADIVLQTNMRQHTKRKVKLSLDCLLMFSISQNEFASQGEMQRKSEE